MVGEERKGQGSELAICELLWAKVARVSAGRKAGCGEKPRPHYGVIITLVNSSHFTRAILRAVRWIAPRSCRDEWFARWDRNLDAWQVLRDRGELSHSHLASLWLDCFRDAWASRETGVHRPQFVLATAAAIVILIGICTQGFHRTRSLFAPIPIEDPASLVSIDYTTRASDRAATLARLIPVWRSKSALARDVAAYRFAYNGSRAWVSWNFLSLLGTKPATGRLLQAGDRDTAVLSYAAWRALYGRNPRIVGKKIEAGGHNYTVVGVMPEPFWALSPAIDIWTPLDLGTPPPGPGFRVGAVARLRPGIDGRALAKELSGISARPVGVSSFANRLPGGGIDFYLLGTTFALIGCLVMVAREHPRWNARNWRYWLFLGAKTMFAIAIPLLLWIEADGVLSTFRPVLGLGSGIARTLLTLMFIVACVRAVWWSFADHRRRCPVCLQRLAMPVSVGSPASVFEPVLTELVCPNGHGALSLPDDEANAGDRWVALDSSWDELFKKKPA